MTQAMHRYRDSDFTADDVVTAISNSLLKVKANAVVNSSWDPSQPHGMSM
jgi:hypothetical protein